MSLQVWLPLNGDLHNQGLSNIIVINNGITIDNNGKLGKCYNFDGIDDYINISNFNLDDFANYSICFWVKSITGSLDSFIQLKNGSTITFTMSQSSFSYRDSKHSNLTAVSFTPIPENTWIHMALIYSSGSWKIYENGILDNEFIYNSSAVANPNTIFYIGRRVITSGTTYFSGAINDFRIYDHALSSKEVEEISKGLLLHYKLDNILNNDNNIYDCSGFGNNGIIAGETYSLSNDTARYSKSISLPNDNWVRVLNRPTIVCPHDAITVNIWAKIASSWTYNRGNIISCQESGGWAIAKTSNTGYFYFQIYADGAYRKAQTTTTSYSTSILTGWHMFTGTADSSTINLYIDGELVATAENTATTEFSYYNNYIFIGAEAVSNNVTPYSAINGLFSDARIYATALTPSQIKELYGTSVTIDKNGNIYAREQIENNSNINTTKTGQLQSNKIVDNNTITIANFKKSDKSINGNTIYEY